MNTRYELMVLQSGAEVVWRTRPGQTPEELHGRKWLSDPFCTVYRSDRAHANKIFDVPATGLDCLPDDVRQEIEQVIALEEPAAKSPETVLRRAARWLAGLLGR